MTWTHFFLETIPNLSIWCLLHSRSINMGQKLRIFSLCTSLLPRRRPKSKVSRHLESLFMRKSCDALCALGSWSPNGIQLNGQTRNAFAFWISFGLCPWVGSARKLYCFFKEHNKNSLLKTVDGKWAVVLCRIVAGVGWCCGVQIQCFCHFRILPVGKVNSLVDNVSWD